MNIGSLRTVVIMTVCAVNMQGCAICKKVFVRNQVCEVSAPYKGARRFLAYQSEPGVFKAELRVRADVFWKAALEVFRGADILESDRAALTMTVRYRDAICALKAMPRSDSFCEVEMKITDFNGRMSYNLWGRSLLKKLYNKATSLSFAALRKFSDDDGK